jgi:hypothetical protein
MASRSPEFLTAEAIGNEYVHTDNKEMEPSLAHSMEADIILMLAGDDQESEKIPLFYFHEGNA